MLNDRRRRILQALVEEYIESATPVGSKTLVSRYELGCSPATVRNELSILEETGFLVQPHISAGRMPTDSGYRSFVDDLLAEDERGESRFNTEAIQQSREVDELLRETSRLLARLTDYLAVVIAPVSTLARISRVDLVSLAPRRALFVLITEAGQVLSRHLELDADASPEALASVERSLNAALVGKRAAEVSPIRQALDAARSDQKLMARVLDEILDTLREADTDRLRHQGLTSLLSQPEFHDAERVRPVVSALEDDVTMIDALGTEDATITVRIGHENRVDALGGVSIVAASYTSGDAEGVVGVVGPTRMDYRKALSAVRAVSEGLTDTLGKG